MIKLKGLLLLMVVAMFSANLAAQGTLEQVTFTHPDIDSPIVFNVALPANYANNTDKHYPLMLDFHYYAHTYLQGMHDWLSHNGEWPWPQTIIVTPQAGNRVGMLLVCFHLAGATKYSSPLGTFRGQLTFGVCFNI